MHGIVTYGGAAPNIVPAHTTAKFYVRSPTLAALEGWEARVRRCFEAGALATGTTVQFKTQSPTYSEFLPDAALAESYRLNVESLGRRFAPTQPRLVAASTDMANVSLAMPAIHPTLGIDSLPATNHQAAFAAHCVTAVADKALLEGATAMAWTVADIAAHPIERERLLRVAYHHGAET